MRKLAPEISFLIPAVGVQGGSVEAAVKAGLDSRGLGFTISTSRAILFTADPAKAALDFKEEINKFRN